VTPATVRVVVVDDSPAFRGAAADVVDATPGFELVGAAESAEGAVATAERVRPDLVLMDVRMPGVGGVEAARQIRAVRHSTVVVLFTAGTSASPHDASLETIDKWSLSPSTLKRLWESHGGLTQQG
jgi:DNA-binding NarL/FixJ family response regulator